MLLLAREMVLVGFRRPGADGSCAEATGAEVVVTRNDFGRKSGRAPV
ncbi:hypothetical protein ACFOLD_03875 [Kocuria carniphila]